MISIILNYFSSLIQDGVPMLLRLLSQKLQPFCPARKITDNVSRRLLVAEMGGAPY